MRGPHMELETLRFREGLGVEGLNEGPSYGTRNTKV